VRYNQGGQLKVPFGYVAALQCDPVEKKPFFHVYPGSDALTFGMMGCDFHCPYCQNWVTSQALRDEASLAPIQPVSADELVAAARRSGARLVVSSYNEPLITAEWAVAVFEKAREQGFLCAFVSNATPPRSARFSPSLDRRLQSRFEGLRRPALPHARRHARARARDDSPGARARPLAGSAHLDRAGFNDGEEELRAIARFIAGLSRDIPWHVTAFHRTTK